MKNSLKDIASDLAITTGMEKFNPRFRNANNHFKQVHAKCGKFRYNITTADHSLDGQVSKYVNNQTMIKYIKTLFSVKDPACSNVFDLNNRTWARLQE